MAPGRARVAASILDADFANLGNAVRRCERSGADRIHLDVMDGHFVPNLTFGARTIKSLRRVTRLPFDAHLMISEPGRYVDEYIDAGCDSITIHVEVEEPISPTLGKIRRAGRAAGLSLRPATPLSALLLGEVLLEAGMPAGMVNVTPCGADLADRLVADDRFKLVTFTGSPPFRRMSISTDLRWT